MRLTTACPACGSPIGVGTFLRSLSPWHVRCPRCREPLRLTRREGAWIAGAVAVGLVAALVLAKAPFWREGSRALHIAIGFAFALVADVVVCALCVMSCNVRRARTQGPGHTPPR